MRNKIAKIICWLCRILHIYVGVNLRFDSENKSMSTLVSKGAVMFCEINFGETPLVRRDVMRSEIQDKLNIVRKLNPYPKEVFTEPTKEEYDLMNKALKEYGLIPDRFFGSLGRAVWENCINELEAIFKDEDEEELDCCLASEESLAKDWLSPEECEAWKDL